MRVSLNVDALRVHASQATIATLVHLGNAFARAPPPSLALSGVDGDMFSQEDELKVDSTTPPAKSATLLKSEIAGCGQAPFSTARYFLDNRSGLFLELQQVGSNLTRVLAPAGWNDSSAQSGSRSTSSSSSSSSVSSASSGSDADQLDQASFQSFCWLDMRTESPSWLAQLGSSKQPSVGAAMLALPPLRRLAHVRGRGALLWSDPFDIDTGGLRTVKVGIDQKE
jgi:hypothetical protein